MILAIYALVNTVLSFDVMPNLTQEAFEAAEKKWLESGPRSYVLDIERKGAWPGIVHVEVEKGVTTAMTLNRKQPSDSRTWDVWAIPGLFDLIDREFEMAEDPEQEMEASKGTRIILRATFDPKDGHPTGFQRAVRGGNAPEVFWKVINFESKN